MILGFFTRTRYHLLIMAGFLFLLVLSTEYVDASPPAAAVDVYTETASLKTTAVGTEAPSTTMPSALSDPHKQRLTEKRKIDSDSKNAPNAGDPIVPPYNGEDKQSQMALNFLERVWLTQNNPLMNGAS